MTLYNLTEDQKNALEIKKHVTLTANAGSGKTFVLTQRFLEILLKTNTSLKQIAAITFTDKAAGELYTKISRSILEASLKAETRSDRLKYEQLRKQLVSANISTIHSFCTQILREFPIEAGIDANFSPIDSSLSKELINLSMNEALRIFEKSEEKNVVLKWLIRIFGSIQSLAAQLEQAINHRNSVIELSKNIYNKKPGDIAQFLDAKIESYISKIFLAQVDQILFHVDRINSFALKNDSTIAEDISEMLQQINGKAAALDVFKILILIKNNILTSGLTVRKDGYLGRKVPVELLDDIISVEKYFTPLSEFENFSTDPILHEQLAVFGKNFLILFNSVLEIYENKKYELGYLDFEDILIKTKNVLELPEVRQKLSQKYRYLMVDEYQDTNEIQYEIFLPILERLKTGNLFVVGDEKQSIYKFRDAELSVFTKTKNDINAEEGLSLILPASFRMSPMLCAFTNHLFRNLFADANPIFNEVSHTDLICAKKEELDASIEILLAEEKKDENSNSESELVAKKIVSLISSDKSEVKLGDIAILCRKRSSFGTLEKTFSRFNLPYIIWEGKGFYQQQIIFDFYNYISFLANTSDETALIGILRSPFFFLSDSEILEISLKREDNFWDKLILSAKNDENLSALVSLLLKHKNAMQSSDLVTLLRTISEETNYLSVIAAREQGQKELANFEKLIQVTRNFFKQGFRNVFDYLNYLKEAIADVAEEGQAQVSLDENAIKIMTVHQAKGLEFMAVFIFDCNKEGASGKLIAKALEVNKEFGLMAKLPVENNFSGKYVTPPIVDLHNFLEAKKEVAELKRLFYVAITRAKNYLYFSATIKPKVKFRQKSFLSLLSQGLNSELTATQITKEIELVFLEQNENREIKVAKPVEFDVKIVKEFFLAEYFKREKKSSTGNYNVNLTKIIDVQKEEIVSASKVAIYNQCPTKYQLTYEYGYNELYDNYKKYQFQNHQPKSNYEFETLEPNDTLQPTATKDNYSANVISAETKGKLVHSILEKDLPVDGIEPFLQKYFSTQKLEQSQELIKNFQTMLIIELTNFYSSETYMKLKQQNDYKNEFQVYQKEKDFYLFGIIDKVIFSDQAITIVDYKTDNVSVEELKGRAQDYFLQLTFYAFILKKLFPEKEKISLQIIFTKFPDELFTHQVTDSELIQLESFVIEMTDKIRKKEFSRSLHHCKQCHFADNRNSCIF
ncbi:MAG: UvrD-helicase domain-containing protein [Ignavibacteria bacterium]|nr:UvrD-helicase domain-containing protein [Ignavibacteria bacterium]